MGGNVVSLAPEMTPCISAAAIGYGGALPAKINEDTPVRQCCVLGEDHPDMMKSVLEFSADKNEDEPEAVQSEDDEDEDDWDEDDWDEGLKPEAMPHGLLSR
jgi:hypothetical protein